MDFDLEEQLEDAGIDAFDFSLMDDDERREALTDAGLDPDDFENVEFDSSFDAWSNLQDAGLSLGDLRFMDEEEKREALEEAGLEPDDYDGIQGIASFDYSSYAARSSELSAVSLQKELINTLKFQEEKLAARDVYRYCMVRFAPGGRTYFYRTEDRTISPGDKVIVPVGMDNMPITAEVLSAEDYLEDAVPRPVEETKTILRKAEEEPLSEMSQTIDSGKPAEEDRPAGTDASENEHPEPVKATILSEQPREPQKTPVFNTPVQPVKKPRNKRKWWWIGTAVLAMILICALYVIPTVRRTNERNTFEALRQDFLNNAEAEYPAYFDAALEGNSYAEYVERMEVTLESSFEKPKNYNFYQITDHCIVHVYVKEEFNQWLDQDKHPLLHRIDVTASYAFNTMCRERFGKYTSYDWLDLKDLYKDSVFPEHTSEVTIYAGKTSYEYAWNVSGQYFVMNGKDHWYDLVPSEQNIAWLNKNIPYVGMPVEFIPYTIVGEEDEREYVPAKGRHEAYTSYLWRAANGRDCPLEVRVRDRKVVEVVKYWEGLYWTADGKPKFDATAADKAQYYKDHNLDFSHIGKDNDDDDYDLDDYEDPEDFWYDHADEFDSYEDAWDYWEENH